MILILSLGNEAIQKETGWSHGLFRGTNFETHFCDPDCQHHVPGNHLLQGSASAKPWEQNLVGKTAKIPGIRMINVLQRRTVEAYHRIVDMNNVNKGRMLSFQTQSPTV